MAEVKYRPERAYVINLVLERRIKIIKFLQRSFYPEDLMLQLD